MMYDNSNRVFVYLLLSTTCIYHVLPLGMLELSKQAI